MARHFLFSYEHNEAIDDRLDEFFTILNLWVRGLTGINEDGFRDDEDLRSGEVWSKALVKELRASPAIVCVYSPSYFKSTVCASELQVFLERRQKHMREHVGSQPANIVPLLWQPASVPPSLPDFQYEKPLSREFATEGVRYVRDFGSLKEFKKIAHMVAIRVKEAGKAPLPDLGLDLALGGISSAFEPPPLPPDDFDVPTAPSGPECVTYVYPNAPAWSDWPFAPQSQPLLYLASAVAKGRDLQSHKLAFDPGSALLPRLEAVRQRNNMAILLIDGSTLINPALAARLREVDEKRLDACSALIVWPPGTRTAAAEQLVYQTFPHMRLKQAPFFFPAIEGPQQFVDAVRASVDTLRNAVIRDPRGVTPVAPTSSFASLPSVSGPGTQRAA